MIGALRSGCGESARVRPGLREPEPPAVELAWGGSVIGHWAYGIALAVYAYDQGGAAAVGLVGLVRFLPAAVAAPFAAVLGRPVSGASA